jgi:hypothetical protein
MPSNERESGGLCTTSPGRSVGWNANDAYSEGVDNKRRPLKTSTFAIDTGDSPEKKPVKKKKRKKETYFKT